MNVVRALDLTKVKKELSAKHADKRSVHTDALETLGRIIDSKQGRDAIHLAVEPLAAGEDLQPGADVGLGADGKAYGTLYKPGMSVNFYPEKHLGIVDPFLGDTVKRGQWFWMIVYPRKITSLRHVWAHPDIPDKEDLRNQQIEESKTWIANYAVELGLTDGEELIQAAHDYLDHDDYLNRGELLDGVATTPEFWTHFYAVTGRAKPPEKYDSFFSCSC